MWKEGIIGIPKKDGGYKNVKYWVKHLKNPARITASTAVRFPN
ncbi:hypothetical protein [uncultured Ruminococcus sp.]